MNNTNVFLIVYLLLGLCFSLPAQAQNPTLSQQKLCCVKVPNRFAAAVRAKPVAVTPKNVAAPQSRAGMVWIEGSTFLMGADNEQGRNDELPKHAVKLNGFFMDITEVTNEQFAAFVKATNYITTAEKNVNWDEVKKQLPPGTPKPAPAMLKAASLVFAPTNGPVNLQDYSQWWQWTHGANWKHPKGPGSTIKGKEKFPVVHISWDDAMAYCRWAKKRLPTEAEWEFAARGHAAKSIYAWGNEPVDKGTIKCNYWQGDFPYRNTVKDGFVGAAPVKSFAPNGYGLFDMSGNVWEWCADLYHHNYYNQFAKVSVAANPQGPAKSYDPDEPYVAKRVMRGGSFLCNESYCSGYRVAARMKSSPDSGMEHLGFRCVADN